jgi:segregation and condensation protein B
MKLSAQIEALLFYKAEPLSIEEIAQILSESKDRVIEALSELKELLVERGLALIEANGTVVLSTAPAFSNILNSLRKEELEKELTKASVETIAIILYKKGATRAEIDYIRGVNSSFILRNLLVRGLIEKVLDPNDARRFIYQPTLDLLSYMGITRIEDAPGFAELHTKLSRELTGETTVENKNPEL